MSIRIFLLLFALSASLDAGAVEISNFKSGLACTKSNVVDGRRGWICQATDTVLVTDQGNCVFNKQEELCTWFGYQFDYKAGKKGAKLQCTAIYSNPTHTGNPKELLEKSARTNNYELELPEAEGHFFNPHMLFFNLLKRVSRTGRLKPPASRRTRCCSA